MIIKINKINKFGIYKDFNWYSDLEEFKKYNLFYGWNGSGKTTLTKLFTILEQKNDDDILKNLSHYEFSFTLENENIIDQNNYQENQLNIFVYNEVFKQKNIDWDNIIKSILLISDKSIKEKTILDEQKSKLGDETKTNTILGKIKKYEDELNRLETEIDKFYSQSARKIKNEFQVIDTSDKYYFNYDKRKFKNFIENNKAQIQKSNKLDIYEVDKLKESIKPNILNKIDLKLKAIKKEWLQEIQNKVLEITTASLVVNEVKRLKEYPQIGQWVEEGLRIHKIYNSTRCEFCNQELTQERLNELEQHFSDEFIKLKERIKKAISWLPEQKISNELLTLELEFYPEYQEEFKKIKKELQIYIKNINVLFDNWIQALKQKLDNPFEIIIDIEKINNINISKYNELIKNLKTLIDKHNNKTDNFEKESKVLKKKLELHFAIKFCNEFGLNRKKKTLEKIEKELKTLYKNKQELEVEIKKLEASLSDEVFGAEEFNKKLHKFLGRKDLNLQFNKELKGYEILRNKQKATNLSEGEKTAISFVYFITKLRENENKIEDSIIVIDDPISSFDSNNLFSAYSFLKNECEQAKQLFVMTHNFTYFKLIRDWFLKKNKVKNGKKIIKSEFYVIETLKISEQRKTTIKKAVNSLIEYQSEYQFIFYQIYQFKDKDIDSTDAYLIGNLLRKLLEAFFSFKYPRKRNDFKALCDVAIKDKELNEKIYRFINKYSHNQSIEFFESNDDNILSESNTIVNDVLKIIQQIDEKHYEEMEAIVLEE
ncbi:AAA family ATPase [Hydrogenimonas thermophila]|uniref:AAA family ATPase n=1 Tax=Hydrogenimonas thermophila TaxID=223786 RepID=UPI0029371210|nr:AAA family ATPase [Hydrogenimonas thermophila]WOE71125.1 AAA family ATPase [Hydrogenimonas thermophila]WOE73643.1 AAA family ATPase [Hydrogenimonas thermophila]